MDTSLVDPCQVSDDECAQQGAVIVPRPPVKLVAPTTAAAIACSFEHHAG